MGGLSFRQSFTLSLETFKLESRNNIIPSISLWLFGQGMPTDLQDQEPLVSTEQTTQPSLSDKVNSNQHTSRLLIDDESPSNCTWEWSNPVIVTDIKGLKLDLLILQKQVEENTKLLSILNAKNQDENASCTELLDYKKRCETLLSSVSKKDNVIRELEEKCLTFESRVLS